jgi:hypothetical protein
VEKLNFKFLYIFRIFFLIFLICFFALTFSSISNAAVVGISPGIINFPNMMREGYSEEAVIITTSSEKTVAAHFEFSGPDWLVLEPNKMNFTFSAANPYKFKVMVKPSADARNGNYTITVRAVTDGYANVSEGGAGSVVLASVALRIEIGITDQQDISCRAGAFEIYSTEIGDPITISAIIYNDGNVRFAPEINIEFWDQTQENIITKKIIYGDTFLPTTRAQFTRSIPNELPLGQYWTYVTMPECQFSQLLTFDVLEKGSIADSGDYVGIRVNDYAYTGDTVPIIAVFKNTGPRQVEAKFKGQIKNMDTNKIVTVLESDIITISPLNTEDFTMYFKSAVPGKYVASGRIYFNKKVSFEKSSKIMNVVNPEGKEDNSFKTILLVMLYVIIMLVIIIIISKIRKQKKRF